MFCCTKDKKNSRKRTNGIQLSMSFRKTSPYGFGARNTLSNKRGQATVEAAIMIPLLFLLLLMLLQPSILLYNRVIMQNAAAEGVRLLSTRVDSGTYSAEKYEGYIKRRLASIPPIDIFHAHTGARTWDIVLVGNDNSSKVQVKITNKVRPLPLLDLGASLFGITDSNGYITQTVEVSAPTQPDWVWSNNSGSPAEWASRW